MENTVNKLPLKTKLAFASGDIFGGGSFNIIGFLFLPFLTLTVGIPMVWASPILLLSKFWDGLIDPFIGKITDAKTPGKLGKRRFFMLIAAPVMAVCLVLLFFPWNIVTDSVPLKIILVIIVYMLYATAQSFILIPYYALASELTDDYTQRNRANAIRIAFSVLSSIVCVAVPGMVLSLVETKLGAAQQGQGYGYIVMAAIFGVIFCAAVIISALFAKEQVHTPPVQNKLSLKQFFRPLKLKTYRQYLGMQMCTSMGMAVMSSFFFIFCDFYLRRNTYAQLMAFQALGESASRFPIATVAAAMMFIAQIFALPMYLKIIKAKNKRFAYITSAFIWCILALVLAFMPGESSSPQITSSVVEGVTKYTLTSVSGTPDWLIIFLAFLMGFGIGGCVYVPHSSLGDVCNVGELYFGERTEGGFSGLTNFLNTTAQAVGLALPPLIMGALGGYVETQYISLADYNSYDANAQLALEKLGMALENFKITMGETNVQLVPMAQTQLAQLFIRLTMSVLPIIILGVGIIIASNYNLTKQKQEKIIEILKLDRKSGEFEKARQDMLDSL